MPATPATHISRGYLIPIGGAEGRHKDSAILERFVKLCGGNDARILVIPTASLAQETGPEYLELFESYGARAVNMPVEHREECFDDTLIDKLENATGIFITGGNQLRLSTILGGTPVARTIRRRNAEGVHLAARLADDDARAGGVDVHLYLATTLDRDVGKPGVGELLLDVVTDRHVLEQELGVVATGEPVRLPVMDVADAKAFWMDLLAHFPVTPLPRAQAPR